MATFKSYAQGGGFKPIQAPDVASMVEAKAKKQSNYMREAAKYNIDERQRIGSTIEFNNDLEFRNRQQRFDFESRNLQAIQNQVMGNYEATISNAQAQSQQQIATLNAISSFSQTAFQTVQAVNEKIETGRKLAVEKTLYATGITTKELMEIHKLDRNLNDQAYQENSAIRAIVDRTGASIQQIRYLRENSNAKLWNESMALATNLGTGYRNELLSKYTTKYNLGDGRQLSLAEVEGRDLAAYEQIMSQIRSEYVANSGMLNLSSTIIGAKIHPLMRSVEAELTQQNNTQYRANAKADAQRVIQNTLDTEFREQGIASLIARLEVTPSGAAKSALLQDIYTLFKNGAESEQRGSYQKGWQDLLASPTTFNGKEVTYGDILTSPAAREVTESFYAARRRDLGRLNLEEQEKQRDVIAFESAVIDRLSQIPGGFAASDVEAAIQEFGERFPGQTSSKLEVMLRNQSVDALEIQRQMKEAEELQSRGLLTMEAMRDAGYHGSVISRFQQFASQASESRRTSNNYKAQLESLSTLAKTPPQVQSKREGMFSPTVPLMEQQLHNKFLTKVAQLQAAGDPNAVANAEAFVRQEFEKNIQNPKFFSGSDYAQFKGKPNVPTAASARMQWVQSNISRLGSKTLDTAGAIFSVSELNTIEEEMKKPGYKMDPMAEYIGRLYGVSPLAVINRQRRAEGRTEPIMPPSVSRFRTQADPKFLKFLDQYRTPEASTRAMISTRQFDETRVPKGYGPMVVQAAQEAGISPVYVAAFAEAENGSWNTNALSMGGTAGGVGLMQLHQRFHGRGATMQEREQSLKDPAYNLRLGAGILKGIQQKYGNWKDTIYVWNMGETGYRDWVAAGRPNTEQAGYAQALYERFEKARAKYGEVSALQSRATMRTSMQRYGSASFERPSSVVFETASGQPGVDLYFESKRFPAVLPGVVKDVSRESGYGNYVVVESTDPSTGEKVDVLYGHLADGVNLRPGQRLNAGDIIGTQGGTGNVRSVDGTIASIDFLAPAPRGSKSMTPYRNFDYLRRYVVSQLQR